MHGSLGRDNTFNNMAAIGPDFKNRFVDTAPVSNADIAVTLAQVMGLHLPSSGDLRGRVLWEALNGGPRKVFFERQRLVSGEAGSDKTTVLLFQRLGRQLYFDEACFTNEHHWDLNPCR